MMKTNSRQSIRSLVTLGRNIAWSNFTHQNQNIFHHGYAISSTNFTHSAKHFISTAVGTDNIIINNRVKRTSVSCSLSFSPLKLDYQYKQKNYLHTHSFNYSSDNSKNDEGGFFSRLWKKSRYSESSMLRHGYDLYSDTAVKLDVLHFFKVLSLEDTFFSWFVVMQLQIWLLCVRLDHEGPEGRVARDALIQALWEDLEARAKQIEIRPKNKNRDIDEMNSSFQTSMVSFDEGLLGSDKDLASAVWHSLIRVELQSGEKESQPDVNETSTETEKEFLTNGSCLSKIKEPTVDPRALEAMVCYIRKQVQMLDNIPSKTFLEKPDITWCKPELPENM